jgi:hypothetical protein
MFRIAHTGGILLLFAVLISGTAAQESVDLHQFTDKKGQKISAMLIGVSTDRQQMKIRREDGQEFETVINLLSLDDQQYVKDWMKKTPMTETAAKSDFRLNVVMTRQTASVEKHTEDYLVLEGRPTTFRIAVRNLSRESLEGARLEYSLVWEDRTTIYQNEDKTWSYSAASDEGGASHRVKQTGEIKLDSLRFNGEATVETVPVSMEQVFIGENNPYREDELIGVKVRILGSDGVVLHEIDSGGAVITAMKWDEILALPAPMEVD